MTHQPNLLRRFFLSVGLGAAAILSLSFLSHADDRDLEPKEHTKDSLSTVKEKIAEKKAVLVDVRDLVEWNAGHVQGAVLVPWRDLQDKLTEAGRDMWPFGCTVVDVERIEQA